MSLFRSSSERPFLSGRRWFVARLKNTIECGGNIRSGKRSFKMDGLHEHTSRDRERINFAAKNSNAPKLSQSGVNRLQVTIYTEPMFAPGTVPRCWRQVSIPFKDKLVSCAKCKKIIQQLWAGIKRQVCVCVYLTECTGWKGAKIRINRR